MTDVPPSAQENWSVVRQGGAVVALPVQQLPTQTSRQVASPATVTIQRFQRGLVTQIATAVDIIRDVLVQNVSTTPVWLLGTNQLDTPVPVSQAQLTLGYHLAPGDSVILQLSQALYGFTPKEPIDQFVGSADPFVQEDSVTLIVSA